MAEYIEREVAVSQANFIHGRWDDVYVSAATLMAMPAADVAPVVRCKDCKYRFKNNGHDKSGCPIIDADIWMDDDDFCSYGERKEGAE